MAILAILHCEMTWRCLHGGTFILVPGGWIYNGFKNSWLMYKCKKYTFMLKNMYIYFVLPKKDANFTPL